MMKGTNRSWPRQRGYQWDYILLILVALMSSMGQQILIANLSEYAAMLEAPASIIGFVPAAYAIAALVSRPFTGPITNHVNKKKALCITVFLMSIPLLAGIFLKNYNTLLALRFLSGVCFGLQTTLSLAMISNVLPDKMLEKGIGIFGMLTFSGSAIGPSIGIKVVQYGGYSAMFLVSFVITLIAFVCALLVHDQPSCSMGRIQPAEIFQQLVSWRALPFSVTATASACVRAGVTSFLVLLYGERGASNVALFFAVKAVVLILSRLIWNAVGERLPHSATIYLTNGGTIFAMILLCFSQSQIGFLLAAVLLGLDNGISQPMLQAMCMQSESYEHRGTASSTYYLGADIGNAMGPMLVSTIASRSNYGYAFLFMAIPMLLGGINFYMNQLRRCGKQKFETR